MALNAFHYYFGTFSIREIQNQLILLISRILLKQLILIKNNITRKTNKNLI